MLKVIYILISFRKKKVRLLKADWTSYLYSCPSDVPDIIANDKNEFLEGKFLLPDGADSLWTARSKPPYSVDVSISYLYFLLVDFYF